MRATCKGEGCNGCPGLQCSYEGAAHRKAKGLTLRTPSPDIFEVTAHTNPDEERRIRTCFLVKGGSTAASTSAHCSPLQKGRGLQGNWGGGGPNTGMGRITPTEQAQRIKNVWKGEDK